MAEVKICGITCEKEIQYLNILKPQYAGFVFAESKRKIDSEKASCLVSILNKDIKAVGVFRNNDLNEIISTCKQVNLYAVQLHGNENFEFIEKLRDNLNDDIKIWKALSINNEENIIEFMERKHPFIDKYLIDGSNPGSGEDYNLDRLKHIAIKYNLCNNFILAGGINSHNVIEKIEKVLPEIVDVSSGVEVQENNKTIKSFQKMKEFLYKVYGKKL